MGQGAEGGLQHRTTIDRSIGQVRIYCLPDGFGEGTVLSSAALVKSPTLFGGDVHLDPLRSHAQRFIQQ